MRILFAGHDFDLEDAQARALACSQYAGDLTFRLTADLTDRGEEIAALERALEGLLAQLADYWLQAAATLAMASATGSVGISLKQAAEMLNFIGGLIGQDQPIDVLTPQQALERAALEGQQDTGDLVVPDAEG